MTRRKVKRLKHLPIRPGSPNSRDSAPVPREKVELVETYHDLQRRVRDAARPVEAEEDR